MTEFNTAVVVDALDIPTEVEDWCCENDISTHCTHSLAMIWCKYPNDNPMLRWLLEQHVDIVKHSKPVYGEKRERIYYVAIIGT